MELDDDILNETLYCQCGVNEAAYRVKMNHQWHMTDDMCRPISVMVCRACYLNFTGTLITNFKPWTSTGKKAPCPNCKELVGGVEDVIIEKHLL